MVNRLSRKRERQAGRMRPRIAAARSGAAERSAAWSNLDRQVRIVFGCFTALLDSAPMTATMQPSASTLAPLRSADRIGYFGTIAAKHKDAITGLCVFDATCCGFATIQTLSELIAAPSRAALPAAQSRRMMRARNRRRSTYAAGASSADREM
jgi:hypothetical protein